jgi:CO/xanthine dehydrogenase FAD-binding subunit
LQLLRPESLEAATAALGNGSIALGGGTDLVPLLRDRIVEAETLVELRGVVPRGIDGTTIGAGTTLGELELDPEVPQALREGCSLPRLSCARWGRSAATSSRRRAAGTGG